MDKQECIKSIENMVEIFNFALKELKKEQKQAEINEKTLKELEIYKSENKKLLKLNKILDKEVTKLQEQVKKTRKLKGLEPKKYKYDEDCVYYLKCKRENNEKCHICRETGKYFYE